MELLDFIGEFVECGYNIKDSAPVMNALGVLRAYLAYHEERGFKPEEVLKKFEKYSMYLPILFILLMRVSPVQDLIAQAFLP